jgi:hypothetical protein
MQLRLHPPMSLDSRTNKSRQWVNLGGVPESVNLHIKPSGKQCRDFEWNSHRVSAWKVEAADYRGNG